MSDADEAAYDRMEERLADIIGGYLRRAGVAFREHDDLACANHLLAEAKKEPLASRLALARALVPGWAVVPREPTEKMCSMGADELPTPTCEATDEEAAAEIYRAMLAAADEPQP